MQRSGVRSPRRPPSLSDGSNPSLAAAGCVYVLKGMPLRGVPDYSNQKVIDLCRLPTDEFA